ncbi:hypothetical protein FGO68_gene6918 [Halteria grandinella]|uniref:Uncharacterized protein n=1 Tax=Halteria grandinella TaxID=5974 RepID=A0A8J8TA96_HALGN|nr:hypothetical protein FGO68_gene6918 [Halteria grandinella]
MERWTFDAFCYYPQQERIISNMRDTYIELSLASLTLTSEPIENGSSPNIDQLSAPDSTVYLTFFFLTLLASMSSLPLSISASCPLMTS